MSTYSICCAVVNKMLRMPEEILERLGATARRLRGDQTMDALAKEIGLSHMTVRRIERGENVNLDSLRRYAQHFGTTIGEMLGELHSEDSDFIKAVRALEVRLDERGREAVLAVARSQAAVRPAELDPVARRAIEAAEAERDRVAEEAARRPTERRASEPPTDLPKRGDAAR